MDRPAYHKDYTWMFNAVTVKGMTVKEISKELNISNRLVEIWIKNHGLEYPKNQAV